MVTKLLHVGLNCQDKHTAERFYGKLLGLKKVKEFTLSHLLAQSLFDINHDLDVIVFGNKECMLEVFIVDTLSDHSVQHICIQINNKQTFLENCEQMNVKPLFIKKGEKTLLFVRDSSGNLFEMKDASS